MIGNRGEARSREGGRLAVARQVKGYRAEIGRQRIKDGIPHAEVERQPVQKHEGSPARVFVAVRTSGEVGPL